LGSTKKIMGDRREKRAGKDGRKKTGRNKTGGRTACRREGGRGNQKRGENLEKEGGGQAGWQKKKKRNSVSGVGEKGPSPPRVQKVTTKLETRGKGSGGVGTSKGPNASKGEQTVNATVGRQKKKEQMGQNLLTLRRGTQRKKNLGRPED